MFREEAPEGGVRDAVHGRRGLGGYEGAPGRRSGGQKGQTKDIAAREAGHRDFASVRRGTDQSDPALDDGEDAVLVVSLLQDRRTPAIAASECHRSQPLKRSVIQTSQNADPAQFADSGSVPLSVPVMVPGLVSHVSPLGGDRLLAKIIPCRNR